MLETLNTRCLKPQSSARWPNQGDAKPGVLCFALYVVILRALLGAFNCMLCGFMQKSSRRGFAVTGLTLTPSLVLVDHDHIPRFVN